MSNLSPLLNCNGWNKMYSSVTVIGATREQILHKMREVNDWKAVFFNWKQPSDKCICFDASCVCPETLASIFSSIGPDIVCYTSTHWYYSYFCVAKGNKVYDNYTAELVDDTPRKCDDIDDSWDCDVLVTDSPSGIKIPVGGGACAEEDYFEYMKIIDTHRV